MVLIECKSCGKQVRDQDPHCWNCGAGMKPRVGQKSAAGGGLAGALVAASLVLAIIGRSVMGSAENVLCD
jgi:hypothetical protein